MERCSKCILPIDLPGIKINKEDICNYCSSFKQTYLENPRFSDDYMQKRFETIINRLKGNRKYDCMVPISGGKDSSYVLYMLVKKFKMNVLTFNHDHGFQSPRALENIERAVRKLGVDYIQYRPKLDVMYKLFRIFLLEAGEFCTACNMLGEASMYRFSKQNNIKLILTGNSKRMSAGIEGISPSGYYDRKYYFGVLKGKLDRKEFRNFVSPPYIVKGIRRTIGIGPETFNVFEYLRPSLRELYQTIEEGLGWRNPGPQIEHGDCLLDPIKNYIMCQKWGCSEITGIYATLVRNGLMSREDALKEVKVEEQLEVPKILPDFLDAIGMSRIEFEKAIKRNFNEIPNLGSSYFFKWCKKTINKLATKRGWR